jgi:hypothetical protein
LRKLRHRPSPICRGFDADTANKSWGGDSNHGPGDSDLS